METGKVNKTLGREAFTDRSGKISWPVRFSYAGGDVACNIVFGMIGTLLTQFYTDTVGITVGMIGIVMLISRIFDGFSDVVMGIIVEKTHSKFGKARPWLLWMSIPFCVSAVLLFTVPGSPSQGDIWWRVVYIFITYNFCTTVCYTAINLPYGTLSTLMTDKSHERDMLGNIRMGLSPIGKIIAATLTPIIVGVLGGTKSQSAWIITMSIWAVVAFILLLVNFLFCKEDPKLNRINEYRKVQVKEEKKDKLPLKQALKFLVKNKYFWAVLILWMFQSVSFGVVGTILPYFTRWVIKDESLYSMLFLTETLVLVGGVFLCMPLVKKVGKRNLALIGSVIALAGQLLYLINVTNVGFLYMSCVLRSIGLAPLNAVVFGMLGDVVDYGHWKNGVRQESFICAGGSVGTKLGSGLASVLITQILNAAGYNGQLPLPSEGGAQSAKAIQAITNIYIIAPIIIAAGVMAVLIFYKLDKHYDEMMNELWDMQGAERLMKKKLEEKNEKKGNK